MCEHCIGEDAAATPPLPPTCGSGRSQHRGRRRVRLPIAEAKPRPNPSNAKFGRVPTPAIVTRAQWGADESIRDNHIVGWAPFRKIVVHHTASPNGVKDPAATVRFGYELHVVGRGFTDIGYNFLISPDGQIFEGRRARKYGSR